MKRTLALALVLALPPLAAREARAAAGLRRFALVVGANRGAAGRLPLRYALSDAERFAELVTRMGGVQPEDRALLRDPTRRAFLDALASTGERASAARDGAARVEVIVYFSGHADDQGLMLGREMLPYPELRAAVGAIKADVGITILDACASGAITRLKGGKSHPAFIKDTSNDVQGYAFLTSSSEDEAAQESEQLRGSFFTYALLSGLRGAADVSGDGRVTLNEAYQFAFQETLSRTATTQAGAQHPAYDIRMAGTGEVVMTDVRRTSAGLILGEEYDGRFFILNGRRQLVAELYKPQGRRAELGLEPGEYAVYFEQEKRLLSSTLTLADGQRQELVRAALKTTGRLPTRRRGLPDAGEVMPLGGSDRRARAQFGWLGRLTLLYGLSPELVAEASYVEPTFGADLRSVLGGVRYYPQWLPWRRLQPHVGFTLGGVQTWESWADQTRQHSYPAGDFGFALGAGLDLHLDRRLSLSLDHQTQFSGARRAHNTWVSVGWRFGIPKHK